MRRVLRTDYTRGERVLTTDTLEFVRDVIEMSSAESECQHARWRWLDCDECRETIGACGEKVCEDCGATI